LPYRESFRVRSYEVDPWSRLSPRALCAYLQEVAGVHATQLGASMERLGESGRRLVESRFPPARESAGYLEVYARVTGRPLA